MMPGLDGFGLLRSLRNPSSENPLDRDSRIQDIPVILLSARAGEESRIEGLEAGADDYLIKPFSARELLARVEATLKLSRLRQEATYREQGLRAEAEAVRIRLESVLSGIKDQFIVLDREWRYTFVNEQVLEVTGKSQEELLGKVVWDIFPDVLGSLFETEVHRAVTEQTVSRFELFYPQYQRWFENRVYPFAEGVTIFVTDVSDRKRAEAERDRLLQLEQTARSAAEHANRIKDEFLAVLSHELRSPLNPILGWSKLLQQRKLDEAATQRALETIERNAKLQTQLIEDLLDVSRILRGKMTLTVSPVNLITAVQAAIETVRLAAEAKQIIIQTQLAENLAPIAGDAARIQQIVWNLLSNAIKFTPAGGKVEVCLESVGNQAQIQVKDTGKGINPAFLPYVFEYFRQEDGTTTRKFGGLGLGLAIVRHLTELHGGTVSAESPGENLGATFTVRIPLNQGATASPRISALDSPEVDLKGLKVLVVDDEADMRDLLAFILNQRQAQVQVSNSASEALAAFETFQPDLLISDIGMPIVDGYTLMQQVRLRSPEQGGQIPAIALTAYAGELDQKQALAVGFQHHLAK
ncbi:MAG TPA: response regulator, partial [Candidatus Obscuribacterales bacterium]